MSYLSKFALPAHAAERADPRHDPGAEQRRRLRVGRRRLDAAAPLPDPRLRGRLVLRGRVDAHARERRRRCGAASRPTARARCRRSSRSRREGRAAEERRRRSSRWRWRPRRPTRRRAKPRSTRCPQVCRTGTHLFAFARYVEQFRGWGRSLRRGVGALVRGAGAGRLAYQAVKYRQREGTTHRDLLRLAHPGAADAARATRACPSPTSTRGCSSGSSAAATRTGLPRDRSQGFAARAGGRARRATTADARSASYGLPREAVQPEHLDERRGVGGAARAACR